MRKFDNYCNTLAVLEKAYKEDIQNEFIVSGIIDKFSIQFELGWKVLKEFILYEGSSIGKTGSPRAIIKEAYHIFDFMDETIWLHMLKDRNDTSHIYDGNLAKELAARILKEYIPEFVSTRENLFRRYKDIVGEKQFD